MSRRRCGGAMRSGTRRHCQIFAPTKAALVNITLTVCQQAFKAKPVVGFQHTEEKASLSLSSFCAARQEHIETPPLLPAGLISVYICVHACVCVSVQVHSLYVCVSGKAVSQCPSITSGVMCL